MSFTLRQIRAFLLAAETGSFTTAAEQMNLTQSAVSMLIRQMEEALGLPLFVRTGRGVELTEFAAEARPGLARALSELGEIADAARGLRELRGGQLRLALPQILAAAWLPGAMAEFRADHPQVRVEIADTVADRVAHSVAARDAEVGIGPERTPPPGIEALPLWDVPIEIALAADAPLAAVPELTAERIGRLDWIHYSDEFDDLLRRTILADRPAGGHSDLRVRNLTTALALLGQGPYATAAPAYARVFAPLFGVVLRSLPDHPTLRRFMLFRRQGHPLSPAAQAFHDLSRKRPAFAAAGDTPPQAVSAL